MKKSVQDKQTIVPLEDVHRSSSEAFDQSASMSPGALLRAEIRDLSSGIAEKCAFDEGSRADVPPLLSSKDDSEPIVGDGSNIDCFLPPDKVIDLQQDNSAGEQGKFQSEILDRDAGGESFDSSRESTFENIPFRWENEPQDSPKACDDAEAPRVRAFQLINDKDLLMVKSEQEFKSFLGCGSDDLVKVVSMFGNTGDGKSYTLNHCFFHGQEVFGTSDSQTSCTAGAWMAYNVDHKAIVIDTEGMLAVSENENERKRLLLKILAVSDLAIYVTRAERLHQDMFQFLEDASTAFCKYFQSELEAVAVKTGVQTMVSSVGPALIIFHETRNTEVLKSDVTSNLVERFTTASNKEIRSFPLAYSDVQYVGSRKPEGHKTDFSPLQLAIASSLAKCTVRIHRAPQVVYQQIVSLNDKFSGQLPTHCGNILPDVLFRCPHRCFACGLQCNQTVSHDVLKSPHSVEGTCKFVACYGNEEYTCQECYRQGQRRVVAKVDSVTLGVVWGAQWHCPKCKVVYSENFYHHDRQKFLEKLRPECTHVWEESVVGGEAAGNTARKAIETIRNYAGVVAAVGDKPVNAALVAVKDWTRPAYWAKDEDIVACRQCARGLATSSQKHHCRRCGEGFCDTCSTGRIPVRERGWMNPVRVCDTCLEILSREEEMLASTAKEREEEVWQEDSDEEVCVLNDAAHNLPSEECKQPFLPSGMWEAVQACGGGGNPIFHGRGSRH
ncbi:hypothetical protein GUITHDRAFT_122825 [Guillardia theta CCMP2712]|uniref:FYVE-type domain-containing protein n=1 Tax=Guillardia theta (strain CCMP2712) TaxID=905079 RepID=L1I408_GUITC|nr:hypothetical protein GUITHDRAFT_122825 [Guillardia theta CCMP2712]EKX30971.1 hypothetical protein GUITHDRAFT_122825 [Guillardia theta CCMP2712]|eukprot:XP_005817951.1 hypothetical protein GUITHDRAFT_122825 [Guillardia theta CCMP2712]